MTNNINKQSSVVKDTVRRQGAHSPSAGIEAEKLNQMKRDNFHKVHSNDDASPMGQIGTIITCVLLFAFIFILVSVASSV